MITNHDLIKRKQQKHHWSTTKAIKFNHLFIIYILINEALISFPDGNTHRVLSCDSSTPPSPAIYTA